MKHILLLVLAIFLAFTNSTSFSQGILSNDKQIKTIAKQSTDLFNKTDIEVTIKVSSCCGVSLVDSLNMVSLKYHGNDTIYSMNYDSNQVAKFHNLPIGIYDVIVKVQGYQTYRHYDVIIQSDMVSDVMVLIPIFRPHNTQLDTVTSMLTWETPIFATLQQNFEHHQFPNNGWTRESNGLGWQRTNDGGSSGFPVPSRDSHFAIVNNDIASSENDGCCDMLITHNINLTYRESFSLSFQSYFTGEGGQTATIFYSRDNGQSWDTLYELTPDTVWKLENVDLSFLSGYYGETSLKLKFQADDHGQAGSGWAIDQVEVSDGLFYPEYYLLHSPTNNLTIEIPADTFSYFLENLVYGEDYIFEFASYACCRVGTIFSFFTSAYLPPPGNLSIHFDEENLDLQASFTVPSIDDSVAQGLSLFTLYMDSVIISTYPYNGQGLDDTIHMNNLAIVTGEHEFCVRAQYDLSHYNYPGETGDSQLNCDSILIVFTGDTEYSTMKSKIRIFPNPANTNINIQSEVNIEQIVLINLVGQTVIEKNPNEEKTNLNTSALESGLYFVRVKTENGVINQRIVIN